MFNIIDKSLGATYNSIKLMDASSHMPEPPTKPVDEQLDPLTALPRATKLQIQTLIRQGLSLEEIAQGLDLPLAAVQFGQIADGESIGCGDITEAQLKDLRAHAYNLALAADSEDVQARMTMALLERARPSKRLEAPASPMQQFNITIQTALTSYEEMKRKTAELS
jgi:hypothetical protein